METGEKIYVESVLTDVEYSECAKKYPSTFANGNKKPAFFNSEFKWRYRMGGNIPADEIKIMNARLDMILKQVKEINK